MPEDLSPPTGKLRVKITSPLSPVIEVVADSISLPAVQGERLIIPDMAPLFCQLNQGYVVINRPDHSPLTYIISKGVAEIRRDICSVMAWGIRPDEINPVKIQRLLSDAESALPTMISLMARQEMQSRIDFYRLLLSYK